MVINASWWNDICSMLFFLEHCKYLWSIIATCMEIYVLDKSGRVKLSQDDLYTSNYN